MTLEGPGDDAGLIRRARSGDKRAYGQLVKRHQEPLYRFVRRYVGDGSEALDLVQEAFVAAWEALEAFKPEKPVGPWLRRIALNKCRDWSRRRAVRRFFFGAASLDNERAAHVAAAIDEADEDQAALLDRLDSAIAKLPQSLKEPLILTVFEGLSHQEAGKVLGMTAKAVENKVYRARKQLATALTSDHAV